MAGFVIYTLGFIGCMQVYTTRKGWTAAMRRVWHFLFAVLRRRRTVRMIPQGLTPAERHALLGPAPFPSSKKLDERP